MNVAEILSDAARQWESRPAIRFRGETFTYGQVEERAYRAACKLGELSIERGDRIVLYLPNHPKFAILYHAIQKVGAVAVTPNPLLTASEMAHEANHAGARLVITSAALADSLPPQEELSTVEAVVLLDEVRPFRDPFFAPEIADWLPPNAVMERDNPAVILYTSGTLGTPKGAVLTHGNVLENVRAAARLTGMTPDDRVLCCVPLFHAYGQNLVMNAALHSGAELVLHERFELEPVVRSIEEHRVTMLFGLPIIFRRFLAAGVPPARLASLRYAFSSAAALFVETQRAWRERYGIPIHQGYGLTETGPLAAGHVPGGWKEGSVGQAIPGTRLRIVHPSTGEVLPAGERGEVAVSGPCVMKGYFDDPGATAQVLEDGWLHTGDLGCLDAEGHLAIVGRLKEMLAPGGLSVSPREVEAALLTHDDIEDAAVVGAFDPDLGESVKAYVVPRRPLSEAEVIGFARQRLASFKVPTTVVFVDAIPRSPAGMRLRRLLRD